MLDVDLSVAYAGFRLQARFVAPTPGVVALFGPLTFFRCGEFWLFATVHARVPSAPTTKVG